MAYIGEIRQVGFNFAPVDWALCCGQSLPKASFLSLFGVIGYMYGGAGDYFRLPDFRGRVAVGPGAAPGNPNIPWYIGDSFGATEKRITAAHVPPHWHSFQALNSNATSATPIDGQSMMAIARGSTGTPATRTRKGYAPGYSGATATLANDALGTNGPDVVEMDNLQPFSVVNYIICLDGTVPSAPTPTPTPSPASETE